MDVNDDGNMLSRLFSDELVHSCALAVIRRNIPSLKVSLSLGLGVGRRARLAVVVRPNVPANRPIAAGWHLG